MMYLGGGFQWSALEESPGLLIGTFYCEVFFLPRNPDSRPNGDAEDAVVHRWQNSRGRRLLVETPAQGTWGAGDFSKLIWHRGPRFLNVLD